jgi:hypothetical protein
MSTISQSVQHTISVGLSDAAQAEAARGGLPAAVVQHYTVLADATGHVARMLDLGASISTSGQVGLSHRCRSYGGREWSLVGEGLPHRPCDSYAALDMIEAQLTSEASAALSAALARPVGESLARRDLAALHQARLSESERASLAARLVLEEAHAAREAEVEAAKRETDRLAAVARLEAWRTSGSTALGGYDLDQLLRRAGVEDHAADQAELARRAKAAEDATKAAEVARSERLDQIVREVGRPLDLGRIEADPANRLGLLSVEEAEEIALDARLPISDTLPAYDPLGVEDVRGDECDEGASATYGSEAAGTVTAGEWAAVAATRARLAAVGLPAGELRRHTGTCNCRGHDSTATRLGIRVSLDLGAGVVVTREYGVSS